ncbi:MAG: DUF4825 domain-containing protein [Defluviitaleaceae bacterium]|nr:DUF4825 domain-containing protein [Defluviitaleaceae bacterium]MCL2239939.1 DUF4825 domain-containing protein [Defluviitaleaceae bacterium]
MIDCIALTVHEKRKIVIVAIMLFAVIALVACNRNDATEASPIPHVGAAHETHNIVFALDLPTDSWQVRSIQIGADHGGFGYGEYTLTIFYEPHSDFEGEITERISEVFFESTANRLFELIGNLQAVTFSINHERTAVNATNNYDYRFSIARSGARQITPTENIPAEELIIQIGLATDELLGTFANLHHAHLGEAGVDLVVWANQPLPHLATLVLVPEWLEGREEWGFSPGDNIGYVEMLLPGEGYVINNYMGLGTLPHMGIGFFDEEKRDTRVFFFQENHAYPEHGNRWVIQEIETDRLVWGVATRAHFAHVGGNDGVLAIAFIDGFAWATLFVNTGQGVISREIGSIEGFPFSVGFTTDGWGRLVKTTGDGGRQSYTMFAVVTNPTTMAEEIIAHFTIYAEGQDDHSMSYYRFNGGWLEGIEGGRYPITEEEFYAIRDGMGDRIICWRDFGWDSTESILAL